MADNLLVKIPFEITEISNSSDVILKDGYTAFPISKLSSLGNAGNQIMNIYKTCMKPGGEGLYMVSFPKGVDGTLSSFSNENAFLGSIKTSDGFSQARLKQVAIDPEKMLIAIALIGIDQKLGILIETQAKILDFLYCKEETTIIADIKMLNDAIGDYKINWNDSEYIKSNLEMVTICKMDAQKSIELCNRQISNIINASNVVHTIEKANKSINELRRFIANIRLSYYLSSYAVYFEYLLKQKFEIDNHKHVEFIISRNKNDYLQLFEESENWIESYSKKSVNYRIKSIPNKIDGIFATLVDKLPLSIPNPYREEQKLYVDVEEQINQIQPYNESGTEQFKNSLDSIYLYNTCNGKIYIDGENIYILEEPKLS